MNSRINRMEVPPIEGWIFPAMFRFNDEAPRELYVKAEPKQQRQKSR